MPLEAMFSDGSGYTNPFGHKELDTLKQTRRDLQREKAISRHAKIIVEADKELLEALRLIEQG